MEARALTFAGPPTAIVPSAFYNIEKKRTHEQNEIIKAYTRIGIK